MSSWSAVACSALARVRARSPLLHHITNSVTMSECANITKCLGAAPVMAFAPEEAADMTALADALVLNIGTLTREQVDVMLLSGKAAGNKGIPVVLDVCGAGATSFRNQVCAELVDALDVSVIKGNASEIAAVAGLTVTTRGVDSGVVEYDLDDLVRRVALATGGVVAMTGAVDRISDGRRLFHVGNGHERMARIVGTGCMATSVIAAFAAVESDVGAAAAAALAWYGLAGQFAAETGVELWDFRGRLFSTIAWLDPAEHGKLLRLEEVG